MEKQLTAEQLIDSELEHEMTKVRNALKNHVATCNECGATLDECDADNEECPECSSNDITFADDDYPRSPMEYINHLLDLCPLYTVYRAQISTNGPGDQFDLYVDSDGEIEQVVYVFLPWFDRAERRLWGQDFEDVKAIFEEDIRMLHTGDY